MEVMRSNKNRFFNLASIVIISSILIGFGASSCCEDEQYNYCFPITIANSCQGCQAGPDGFLPASKTIFTSYFDGRVSQTSNIQEEICVLGKRNGGQKMEVRLTKVCKHADGSYTVQSCSGSAFTTPACDDDDNGRKIFPITLNCDCIDLP